MKTIYANNISKSFVETANGVIFEKLHEAGIKFEENLPSIEKAKQEAAAAKEDYEAALKKHKEMGVVAYENADMGIYFIADPDGYWTEIIPAGKY